MKRTEVRGGFGAISGMFVFLLLGCFAVFSTLMVLLSAQLYRVTVDQTQAHSRTRLPGSYLMNVLRANDCAGSVSVREIDGLDVLTLMEDMGESAYCTQIYCYDGALRERYADAEEPFDASYGEAICELASFTPILCDGMLEMRLTDEEGSTQTLHMHLRCAGEEAGA